MYCEIYNNMFVWLDYLPFIQNQFVQNRKSESWHTKYVMLGMLMGYVYEANEEMLTSNANTT